MMECFQYCGLKKYGFQEICMFKVFINLFIDLTVRSREDTIFPKCHVYFKNTEYWKIFFRRSWRSRYVIISDVSVLP